MNNPESESELVQLFVQKFDPNFRKNALEIAQILAKLGIQTKSDDDCLNENVFLDILRQFENTLNKIGNMTMDDQQKQLVCYKKEINSLITKLETLKMRKEQTELTQEEQCTKKQNFETFKMMKKDIVQSLNKLALINEGSEKSYMLEAKIKNETLKKEIESLEEELTDFNFDLDDEQCLDMRILQLEKQYKKILNPQGSF